jgi:hypothetical protein
MTGTIVEKERRIPVLVDCDVIVAGAGVSGVAAAVGAARAGAKTILLERAGFLGGVASAGLMTSMTNFIFTGDNRHVVRGFCEELLDRLAARGGTTPHWRTRKLPQIPFDQQTFRLVLAEMVRDAGIEALVEVWTAGVLKDGDAVTGVVIETKGGRQAVLGKVTVDATGDADLVAWAGAPCRDAPPDSGSLLFQMSNADLDETVAFFEKHPEEWQQYSDRVTPLEDFIENWRERDCFHLPHHGAPKMALVKTAIERGEYARNIGLCKAIDALGMFAYRPAGQVLINSINFAIDHLDPRLHAQAEMEAHLAIPVIAAFLNTHFPGFEKAIVTESAAMIGVRATRWIDAGFDLTFADQEKETRWPDAVGVVAASGRHPKGGVTYPPMAADIPYRMLLPQNVDNLINGSGKSVSTTPRGLMRGQVPCMVFGQAAGVAAAVAAMSGTPVRAVPIKDVQKALLAQHVYLGEADRLAELGLK